MLADHGYTLYATPGSQKYLEENGIPAKVAHWPGDAPEGEDAVDLIRSHTVDLVVNVPKNFTRRELTNGYRIRRAAVDFNVPLITNARLASAFIRAFCTLRPEDLAIKAWDEYQ
jgi:carbamoyl-phosphate synthase large subunit